jgi:hypothetical protein
MHGRDQKRVQISERRRHMRYLEMAEVELKELLQDPIIRVEVQRQSFVAFGSRRNRKSSKAPVPVWKLRPFYK